jgi:hypothetical protein
VYLQEPGRFRKPRDAQEAAWQAPASVKERLFPASVTDRLFLCHSRPEVLLGHLRPLDLGAAHTRALGYINRGGTLDVKGLLTANRCTWMHALQALAEMTEESLPAWLDAEELDVLSNHCC